MKNEKTTETNKEIPQESAKILNARCLPKKIAKIFALLWTLCLIVPVCYVIMTQSEKVKEYSIVRGISLLDTVLFSQSAQLTDSLSKDIKVEIPNIPTIDSASLEKQLDKVREIGQMAQKFRLLKNNSIEETVNKIQGTIDDANEKIRLGVQKAEGKIEKTLQNQVRKSVSYLIGKEMKKQLGLSEKQYKTLQKGNFGLFENQTETHDLYQNISEKSPLLKTALTKINQHFHWMIAVMMILSILILLIPVFIVSFIAKKLSKTFTECPYCHKVFLSKAGGSAFFKSLIKK